MNSQPTVAPHNLKLQKRLMPAFFAEKGAPERKSMRGAKFTKPNTTLKEFS